MALNETPAQPESQSILQPEQVIPVTPTNKEQQKVSLFGRFTETIKNKVQQVKDSEKLQTAFSKVKDLKVNKETLKKGLSGTKNVAIKAYQKTYNGLYGKLFGGKEVTSNAIETQKENLAEVQQPAPVVSAAQDTPSNIVPFPTAAPQTAENIPTTQEKEAA